MKILSIVLFLTMITLFARVCQINPKASFDDGSFMWMIVLLFLGIAAGIGGLITAYIASAN